MPEFGLPERDIEAGASNGVVPDYVDAAQCSGWSGMEHTSDILAVEGLTQCCGCLF
jgi:hypothetical protein